MASFPGPGLQEQRLGKARTRPCPGETGPLEGLICTGIKVYSFTFFFFFLYPEMSVSPSLYPLSSLALLPSFFSSLLPIPCIGFLPRSAEPPQRQPRGRACRVPDDVSGLRRGRPPSALAAANRARVTPGDFYRRGIFRWPGGCMSRADWIGVGIKWSR